MSRVGEELQAWKKWGNYWDHVDFEAREREEEDMWKT